MMKKNTEKTKKMKGMFLWTLPLILVSCSSFQGVSYYGDGIYGEELPEVITYVQQEDNPISYKSYFNEMVEKAKKTVKDYSSFTDVNSFQSATNQPSSPSWGQNTSRENVTINMYDNFNNGWGYDPYYNWNYRNNYYWGMGVWSPYYRNSWGYYGPINRINFGFGWSYGWDYPYYGYNPYYYYGYNPYYYDYNPYYYGGYYPYYGNRVYRNSSNYAYARGRRGGNMDYSSSRNTSTRGEYNNRSYSRREGNISPNRSYSRTSRGSYTPSSSNSSNSYSRETTPTYSRSYEGSSYPSSRSYNRTSNPSSGRTYSRGHRGG